MMLIKALIFAPLLNPLHVDVQGGGCLKYKKFRPIINYTVQREPTLYVYHHSRKALTERSKESTEDWKKKHEGHAWLSSLGSDTKWHTEGITKGAMRVETQTQMVGKPYDKYGVYYCPFVKQIDVTIIYSSEIFIASELKKKSCEFNAVMEHEIKHHDTNVTVVNTIAKRMEADTPKILRYMERKYIMRDKIEEGFTKIKLGIRDALKVYGEEITARMDEFNSYVDTPEEYKHVAGKCKSKR